MIFWGKWYREILKKPPTAEMLEIWSISLICHLMNEIDMDKDSQLTEITQTAGSIADESGEVTFTETVAPQVANERVTNIAEDLPQNTLSSTGNWQPGYQLKNGKYTIEKELGKGGFGITYLATDRQNKPVVIKMLKDELRGREDFKQLEEDFVNEAVKLSQFKHPNIVPIIEVISDRGWCIVMEYIQGKTLDALVKESDGYLSTKEALHYIKQIGEALKAVHSKGLLHRDIKPQNILIRENTQEAVLIDFGLALKFNRNPVANSGGLSHGYASLEQYQRNVIWDYYTDVYALAATLYFALTKTKPISAVERAGAKKLASPQDINPAIDRHLNETIEKGMSLDPTSRPQTVKQWFDLLQTLPKKKKLPIVPLVALFLLGLGSSAVYFILNGGNEPGSGELVVGKTIESQCTESNLNILTQRCQKNYFFVGSKGEIVTIEMSSDEIDSLLVLMDTENGELARNDDIDVNNFNAKIDMELPKDGRYIVSTESSQKKELGTYTLRFSKN